MKYDYSPKCKKHKTKLRLDRWEKGYRIWVCDLCQREKSAKKLRSSINKLREVIS